MLLHQMASPGVSEKEKTNHNDLWSPFPFKTILLLKTRRTHFLWVEKFAYALQLLPRKPYQWLDHDGVTIRQDGRESIWCQEVPEAHKDMLHSVSLNHYYLQSQSMAGPPVSTDSLPLAFDNFFSPLRLLTWNLAWFPLDQEALFTKACRPYRWPWALHSLGLLINCLKEIYLVSSFYPFIDVSVKEHELLESCLLSVLCL